MNVRACSGRARLVEDLLEGDSDVTTLEVPPKAEATLPPSSGPEARRSPSTVVAHPATVTQTKFGYVLETIVDGGPNTLQTLTLQWSSPESSLSTLIRAVVQEQPAIEAAVLDWHQGHPLIQLAVNRDDPAARRVAYDAEAVLSQLLANAYAEFRLLNPEEVGHAVASGAKLVFKR